MARITRAMAAQLAKDNNVGDSSNPSSSTPQLDRPPLGELDINPTEDQADAPMDDGIDAEIKGLKAAFRDAIGAGSKKRRNRNRKRNAKQNQLKSLFAVEESGNQEAGQDENRLSMQSSSVTSEEKPSHYRDQAGELSFLDAFKAKVASPSASPKFPAQRTPSGPAVPTLRRTRQQARLETYSFGADSGQPEKALTASTKEGSWLKLDMEPRSFSDTVDAGMDHNMPTSTSNSNSISNSISTIAELPGSDVSGFREEPGKKSSSPYMSTGGDGSMLEMSQYSQGNASTPKIVSHASPDSFRTAPTSASPAKRPVVTFSQIEVLEGAQNISPQPQEESDDSFLTQIISRTPAKPVPRIEDTLEKLDIYEDEIEAVLTSIMDRSRPNSHESTPTLRNSASRLSCAISPTTNALAEISKNRESEATQQMRVYYKTKLIGDSEPSKQVSAMRTTGSSSDSKTVTFDENIEQPPHDESRGLYQRAPAEVKMNLKIKEPLDATTIDNGSFKAISKTPSSQPHDDSPLTSSFTPSLRKAKSMPFKASASQTGNGGKQILKSLLPPKQLPKTVKPVTRPAFELPGDAVARKLKEQREARLSLRESGCSSPVGSSAPILAKRTIKSSKPPTKPSFELPGDELSRKKKEALKVKLEAEEVEEKRRREFKAKPLRKSVSAVALNRDTVASRANQTKLDHNIEKNLKMERTLGHHSISQRSSIIGLHRPSIADSDRATTPTIRLHAPGPAAIASVSTKSSDLTQPASAIADGKRTIASKRGKEIYRRAQALSEELEAEKHEREAAAKRARSEAAEKGREASREWAEKQRAKKVGKEQ